MSRNSPELDLSQSILNDVIRSCKGDKRKAQEIIQGFKDEMLRVIQLIFQSIYNE